MLIVLFLFIIICDQKAFAADAADSLETPSSDGAAFRAGRIPYSNQWEYDEAKSILLLSVQQLHLNQAGFPLNSYEFKFTSENIRLLGFNYFGMQDFKSFRPVELWAQYGVGIAFEDAAIISPSVKLSDVSQQSEAIFLQVRFGEYLSYRSHGLLPFVGPRLSVYGYRHTSSLAGMEKDGSCIYLEPVAGLVAPTLWGRLSGMVDISVPFAISDSYGFFNKELNLEASLGLSF